MEETKQIPLTLDENQLETPSLDNLGTETTPEIPSIPQYNQPQPQEFKEMLQLEVPNGLKIILGSTIRPVEVLADIALQLKIKLEQKETKQAGTYCG